MSLLKLSIFLRLCLFVVASHHDNEHSTFTNKPIADTFHTVSMIDMVKIEQSSMFLVKFSTQNITIQAHVQPNVDLFHPEAQIYHESGMQNPESIASLKPTAYTGSLVNGKAGSIRLSLLPNNGFHAMVTLHETSEVIMVDPLSYHDQESLTGSHKMISYKLNDITDPFVQHRVRKLLGDVADIETTSYGRLSSCGFSEITSNLLRSSIGIAADAGYCQIYGANVEDCTAHIVALMNTVNALYIDQIGVHLQIGALRLYTTVSNTSPSWNVMARTSYASSAAGCGSYSSMDRHLDAFSSWVSSGSAPLCGSEGECGVWHLLTNCGNDISLSSNVAGLAYVGTVCQRGFATGVSTDLRTAKWTVVAHEIGHNFGASHASTGIMSYNSYSTQKFTYESNNVCYIIQRNIGRCFYEYEESAAVAVETIATTEAPVATTRAPTPVPTVAVTYAPKTPAPTVQETNTPAPTKYVAPAPPATTTATPVAPTSPPSKPCTKPTPAPTQKPDCDKSSRKLNEGDSELNMENRDVSGACACLSADEIATNFQGCADLNALSDNQLCFVSPQCVEFGLFSQPLKCSLSYRMKSVYAVNDKKGTWNVGKWSACSASCGGGIKTRKITCNDKSNANVVIDDSECPATKLPETEVAECNTNVCDIESVKSADSVCDAPSNANCAKLSISNSCECSCHIGFYYDAAFDTCLKSTAAVITPYPELFYVDTAEHDIIPVGCNGGVSEENSVASTESTAVAFNLRLGQNSKPNVGSDTNYSVYSWLTVSVGIIGTLILVSAVFITARNNYRAKQLQLDAGLMTPTNSPSIMESPVFEDFEPSSLVLSQQEFTL